MLLDYFLTDASGLSGDSREHPSAGAGRSRPVTLEWVSLAGKHLVRDVRYAYYGAPCCFSPYPTVAGFYDVAPSLPDDRTGRCRHQVFGRSLLSAVGIRAPLSSKLSGFNKNLIFNSWTFGMPRSFGHIEMAAWLFSPSASCSAFAEPKSAMAWGFVSMPVD
ncbi:hypothetical protein [Xanthomonas rydalmerensis]|uniref:Uncharacterized protein n=1 Tax=Xanthomonas rydalmerensis TaxID=3046274 RepID=A0ABZ0JNW8_9XANT|nr:hypothetical protein [Xanthomonas sp. DM-2023]WOS40698.1 hypothetical protein QN243_20270 [Xanthomonas sp. DM-2023]WOS44882.1 hypothetical protein QN242_20270 [Xanthomonas sp. DM-2023]WOS49062.1 hypothetical protein QN240_20270 [Xanthomonas sp. DM-2023]WOS53242.1 hypothetical protein QN244_20275 [Xanthomonas sp. DM-2023]WOS57425.1 hypothetical protein QN245_20270 [Xanthomonas sp. DM-2023]